MKLKSPLRIILVLTLVLTNCATAMQDYIGAVIMIPTEGKFLSLNNVIDKYLDITPKNRTSPLDKLDLLPLSPQKLHMTLSAVDIEVPQNLTTQEKATLLKIVKEELKKATEEEIVNTLNWLKKNKGEKKIELHFTDFEIYEKFFVANFNARPLLCSQKGLLGRIEKNFEDRLENSKEIKNKQNFSKKPFTAIKSTYDDCKPHVSLAKIDLTNMKNQMNPFYDVKNRVGTKVGIKVTVPNFMIGYKKIISSAFWKQK